MTCASRSFQISPLRSRVNRRRSPCWSSGRRAARSVASSLEIQFLLEILANWEDPECNDSNIAWARAVFEDMGQCSRGKPNFNFPGVEDDMKSFVRAAFGEQYERLVRVKRKYDPANVFRANQTIT